MNWIAIDNMIQKWDRFFGWFTARVMIPACITISLSMTALVMLMYWLGIDRIKVAGGVIDLSASSFMAIIVMLLLTFGIYIPMRRSFLRMLK